MFDGLVPFSRRSTDLSRRPSEFAGMRNMIDDFFNDSFLPAFFAGESGMKTDVRETDKEYLLDIELPGTRKEDIRVDYRDGNLTVAVENNEVINEEGKNYIRKERRYGSRSRSFTVDNIKEDAIKAKFENGILSLTLPKQEGPQISRRQIEIE